MAMEEIERKLEESMQSLREENKYLVDLLQSRQSQFYDTVRDYPDLEQTNSSKDISNGAVLIVKARPTDADVVGICTSGSSTSARQKLSSCRKDKYELTEERENYLLNSDRDGAILTGRHLGSHLSTPDVSRLNTPTQTARKSILKHRELIANHVKVNSKYDHGPDWLTEQRSRLNYSYDDMFEQDLPAATVIESLSKDRAVRNPSNVNANAERYLEHLLIQRKINDELRDVEKARDERLLVDSGNNRQQARVVLDLKKRPKSVLFDVKEPDPDTLEETMKRYTPRSSVGLKRFNYQSDLNASRQGRPLLGYDWIAGILENEGLWSQSEEVFQGISEFRKNNQKDCIGKGYLYEHSSDLSRPISPEVEDPGHTCIHGFSVNERLFTEAVNIDEEGNSVCPVCLITRKNPTTQEPAFVRVSIPKSTVENAYKVKPRTRKSFEPSDSMALAHHCLVGWKSAKPSSLPTARTLDIKDKVINKETTTYDEARQIAESFSRMGRLLRAKDTAKDRLNKSCWMKIRHSDMKWIQLKH